MILAAALLAAGLAGGSPARALISRPDVLVVILDDVGWTERPYLPSLDALAAQGVTLTRAYSWPVCSPTRYAALTGRLPRRAGMGDVVNAHNTATGASPPPDRTEVTLAEVMLPSYRTALVGKWHLGRLAMTGRVDLLALTESGPFGSGFENWLAGNPNSIAQGPGATGYRDWYRVDDSQVTVTSTEYATDAQRDAFLAWWGATPGPRLAWLAFNAAHQPYDPPPGYPVAPTTRDAYLQVVDYLDGALAAVLAAVDLGSTYVVVLGDNGTPDDARQVGTPSGYWKGSTYEGGVRVPMIVAGPGILPGTSDRLVSVADLPATVLELVGLVPERGFDDAVSFADELGSWAGAPARTWLHTERYDVPCPTATCPQPEGYDDQAVIERDWKLRRWDADGVGPGASIDRAYYLPNDPFEQNPIDPLLLPQGLRDRLYAELAAIPPRA